MNDGRMNELTSEALGKYLVAAEPNGLSKIGFEYDGDDVEISVDSYNNSKLDVYVNGLAYASIYLSVQYWEHDDPDEEPEPEYSSGWSMATEEELDGADFLNAEEDELNTGPKPPPKKTSPPKKSGKKPVKSKNTPKKEPPPKLASADEDGLGS